MSEQKVTLTDILAQLSRYLSAKDLLQITCEVSQRVPLDRPISGDARLAFFRLDASDPEHPKLYRGDEVYTPEGDENLLADMDEVKAMDAIRISLENLQQRYPLRVAIMSLRFLLDILSGMLKQKQMDENLLFLVISSVEMVQNLMESRCVDCPIAG